MIQFDNEKKLVIADLDGTLVDTKDINFHAYRDAVKAFGYDIDYDYYCKFCNGRHYMEFLPQITTDDETKLKLMHDAKKSAYGKYIDKAVLNLRLVDILDALKKNGYNTALVTTASRQNCEEILHHFSLNKLFDLVLTHEDIKKTKPDPEGFVKAMEYFNIEPDKTVIFEDSDVGLEAAKRSGAFYFRTFRFN